MRRAGAHDRTELRLGKIGLAYKLAPRGELIQRLAHADNDIDRLAARDAVRHRLRCCAHRRPPRIDDVMPGLLLELLHQLQIGRLEARR